MTPIEPDDEIFHNAEYLWRKAFNAAGVAARAKRAATTAGEMWRAGKGQRTDASVDYWAEMLKATSAWRLAQAETHAANAALLEALGCDWRNHL